MVDLNECSFLEKGGVLIFSGKAERSVETPGLSPIHGYNCLFALSLLPQVPRRCPKFTMIVNSKQIRSNNSG